MQNSLVVPLGQKGSRCFRLFCLVPGPDKKLSGPADRFLRGDIFRFVFRRCSLAGLHGKTEALRLLSGENSLLFPGSHRPATKTDIPGFGQQVPDESIGPAAAFQRSGAPLSVVSGYIGHNVTFARIFFIVYHKTKRLHTLLGWKKQVGKW